MKKELKGMAKDSIDGEEEMLSISEVLELMDKVEGR